MRKTKILINTPHLKKLGGVSNHYIGLKNFWREDVFYNQIGSRYSIPGYIILPFDLITFFFKCLILKPDVILLNPSLGKTALQRDALFSKIATWLKIKHYIFIHGWSKKMEDDIMSSPSWFTQRFQGAKGFFVLAQEFKQKLELWSPVQPVFLTTTKVDDELIKNVKVVEKKYGQRLLFLSRIEKNKGVLLALESFRILKDEFKDASFTVVGDGKALAEAKAYVDKYQIPDVRFLGKVSGTELKGAFSDSDLYVLPTSHGEGMPTSILEAMAFGLPVITRSVGGIKDFFENDLMGKMTDSLKSEDFVKIIREYLNDPEVMKRIGHYNHFFAKKNFLASQVAKQLELILNRK